MQSVTPCLTIGIAGGTGAGKSTLVRALQEVWGLACEVVQHDWYYHDRPDLSPPERAAINFDHPDALETDLLIRDLNRLQHGRPAAAPAYDFATHRRTAATRPLRPAPFLIVEGILVLADPRLRQRFDLTVYVDAEADVRLARRLRRDVRERGRDLESVLDQYFATVRPMHDQFVAPYRAAADLIVGATGPLSETAAQVVRAAEALQANRPARHPPGA